VLVGGVVLVVLVVAAVVAAATGQFSDSSGSPSSLPSQPSILTPTIVPRTSPRATRSSHPARSHRPFVGLTVGVDPGHNGGNFSDTSFIDRPIWNGREHEACNTTGTETDAGYPEARFTFNVATYLASDLRSAGARVVMTRHTNSGVGPCVNRRAQLINASHAAVAIDIHADGGPATGRGFAVLEPVADGPNDSVVGSSRRYGTDVRNAFERTGMPTSSYDGTRGITVRDDLAGLNLTTVPQVLIECGNMRNPTDAALLVSAGFQRRAAAAIMAGMATFLTAG
jgi:N-acetylmuramoyl-L-alanine amidase